MWFYKKKGFTLLELMIVIVIIGILAALAIPRFYDAIRTARNSEAKGSLGEIYRVDQAYYTLFKAHFPADASLNGDTLAVDLDPTSAAPEISLIVPDSGNFTYSIDANYIKATIKTGVAADNWRMGLDTGLIESF